MVAVFVRGLHVNSCFFLTAVFCHGAYWTPCNTCVFYATKDVKGMGVVLGQDYCTLEWDWPVLATRRITRAAVVAAADGVYRWIG